jgi:5-methylcytosine-specific restriction protein B
MLDFALRRRFAFFDLKPGFDAEGFGQYRQKLDSKRFDALINAVKRLNKEIASDDSLGEGFCIGHSFFCGLTPESGDSKLPNIVDFELIPLLKEYWYDEPANVADCAAKLRAAIQ